jgi:hypothetical protein
MGLYTGFATAGPRGPQTSLDASHPGGDLRRRFDLANRYAPF